MARFFIDRPIFAWVLAIIIMIAGAISLTRLPVAQYPNIAPPTVSVSAAYPGASATVVEESVTQIIEQGMKGLDGLIYMSSSSESSGQASVTLTFESGTDPDIAQVQVQNKLQLVTPLLPQIVQQQGVNVSKSGAAFLMVIGFVSEDGSMAEDDIADFVAANVVDPLARVRGVGNVQAFGTRYAMRIWLDPGKLETYHITPDDVIAQIRAQNQQVAIGQLGGTPAVPGQQLNAAITAQGRLQTPEQFRAIVLRGNPDGSSLLLGDVARVELGAADYSFVSRYNGQPASGIAISLTSGANSLETARAVEATIEQLKLAFPPGLKAVVPFDTTPFVRVAIQGVILTLLEAIALVFLVMYLFLQNFRATLIPTIAVPVVLLGTFAVLAALGYSVNMLTMFAMVLAIGLLVDDAIVVVENVERVMHEDGLGPVEATRKSMDQITGALVGIGLVLAAVFVPMAFLTGSTGIIYRQFSATIVSAMALSVLVALVLTPALCATMLKQGDADAHYTKGGFFGWFNRTFDRGSERYRQRVRGVLSRRARFMAVFAAMAALMVVLFLRLPSAFLPQEDQGWMMAQVVAPVGATQQRTMKAIEAVEKHFMQEPAVKSVFTVQGFSFGGSGQNTGIAWVNLKDWSERKSPDMGVQAVAARAMGALMQIKDAFAFAFAPPPLPELGSTQGLAFFLTDNAGLGRETLRRGAQPVPRRGGPEQEPRQRPPERPRGRAATAHHRRPDEVRLTRPARLRHQRHARDGLGRPVHRRLHRPRARQASVRPVRRTVPHGARGLQPLDGTQREGRDGALLRVRKLALGVRLAAPRAFRRHAGGRDQRRRGARREHGNGDGRSRAAGRAVAEGHRRRLDRPVLPGAPGRRADAVALHALAARGVPVPRGDVRELDDPDRRAAGRPARHPRHRAGSHAARHGARRLLPGRDADDRGPLEQERDPDHRVRKGEPRSRHGPGRGDDGRRARPPAPDPDDLARLRPRRAAARDRDRRRLGRAARDRHRRARRHARGHAARHVLHAAVLRRRAEDLRPPPEDASDGNGAGDSDAS